MKILYKKKCVLLFDFNFMSLIENHLFSYTQIIILFKEFDIPFFFQSFIN